MPTVRFEEFDWSALLARYEAMGVGFARGLVGDPETARDIYQEAARATWERAANGAVRFESTSHARNYLFQVLRNLAIDERAGRRRSPQALPSDPVDPDSAPQIDRLARDEQQWAREAALRSAWHALPARDRQALHMRYLEGKTYKEMAIETGRSISTLQARVAAGLQRLRERIGKPEAAE